MHDISTCLLFVIELKFIILLSDAFNPKDGQDTNCCYVYLLLFVYGFEHLLTSMYKIGHNNGYLQALNWRAHLQTQSFNESGTLDRNRTTE